VVDESVQEETEDEDGIKDGPGERFARFGLKLKAEKTRLIEFGRFAARDREARGLGKPETFEFLGFTHICGKTRAREFRVLRKTVSKRRQQAARVQGRTQTAPAPVHTPAGEMATERGPGPPQLQRRPRQPRGSLGLIYVLRRLWMKALQRRSQKTRMTWPRFSRLAAGWLPRVRNMHPYPDQRFAATHPR
jgi:RNA-directed DNA polymerase